MFKSSGGIDDLTLPDRHDASVGIGHTRWNTHGEPTDEKAHPHTDCSGDIAVVHNVIIDNYGQLKASLVEDGHQFRSETTTEVVPHLLEIRYDGDNLLVAVDDAVYRLHGSFALAVTTVGYDGIVVAREDSPLVVGVSADANFVASVVTAFLEHTQDVLFLEDGDVAAVTDENAVVHQSGEEVTRETQTVDWEAESAEKAGYEHYMLKEINEQPQALRQTISGRLKVGSGNVDLGLDFPSNYLKNLEEIQIVACGTSNNAGLYARHCSRSTQTSSAPSRPGASTSSRAARPVADARRRRHAERRDS